MVVEPPETPSALVQQIERPMAECGLDRDRVRIVFSAEKQRVEIHVPQPSGASVDTVSCLVRARGIGRFLFEEEALQRTYSAMLKLYLDQSFAAGTEELKRQGKLEALPKSVDFENPVDFAQTLETYCGLSPGSVLQVSDGSTMIYPPDPSKARSQEELESIRCISAAFGLTALERDIDTWRDLSSEFDPIRGGVEQ